MKKMHSERKREWLELISIFIMAIATVAIAWSGYQAARWGGEMSSKFSQANARRTESMRSAILGGQKVTFDALVFNEWLKAVNMEDEALSEFYFNRMGDLRPAVEQWIATNPITNPEAPLSPFAMASYIVPEFEVSQNLEEQASSLFFEGLEASDHGDGYILNAVILASVLFFAGIATRFKQERSQIFMLSAGSVFLIFSLFNIFSSPIL